MVCLKPCKFRKVRKDFVFHSIIAGQMAADILGMTRQSFNRNKRIKRGFIMYHKMGDFSYYLRKSVEMYKKTSDGRYPL